MLYISQAAGKIEKFLKMFFYNIRFISCFWQFLKNQGSVGDKVLCTAPLILVI